MYLIDTNIFLELLLNQERKNDAEKILTQIEREEIKTVISGYSLHSIEFILSIKKKNTILREFLQALNDLPNITVYHTTIDEDIKILDVVEETKLDFDDANQYYIAKKFEVEIITFDKDFKVIKDLNIRIL